jgi:DNA helicase-2/ATP-dependent DNA helicase PcrA
MTVATSYLEGLNPEQRRAVEHGVAGQGADIGADIAGPLLVIAGAGSGKTNTLAHRVAHLIVNGADPRRMLLLTFSRRAAAEMERRVERIVARTLGQALREALARSPIGWCGTFHAMGARLLRTYARSIGLDPGFTIHDREDSADLMNLVRHELGLSEKAERFPLKGTCLGIYSRAVNASEPLDAVLRKQFPWCAGWQEDLRRLFEAYVDAKQKQQVLDYDDLLLYWAELMQVPQLAGEIGGLFDHVLVDEYQDTNALQASILLGLKSDGAGLTVVGDDAQAIYGFRAATVRNILDFPQAFTPPATLVTLERNYRSTPAILDASNAVIGLARERFTKNLRSVRPAGPKPALVAVLDDARQAGCIVAMVLDNRERGMALREQAVLFRTAHHSAVLEIELARRNIPFRKFGGLRFIEAAHVKDMLAILRWVENPADRVTGFRVLQLLDGIGAATASKVLDAMPGTDALEALSAWRPPARAAEPWRELVRLFEQLRRQRSDWPAELDLVRRWYQPLLEQHYEDAHVRAADLDQLARIAATCPSRARFLTDLTLDPPDAASGEAEAPHRDEDYLILSTIHSAKGQEWKAVYVLNVVDGCIPSDMATGSVEDIEEERRLLYVAMTRAKDQLMLVLPQRFYTHQQARRGDRHVYAARSRFIPGAILDRFEMRTWPAAPGIASAATASGATVDLMSRMRGRWQRTGT